MNTDSVVQGVTYTEIEAGNVDTGVLDFTGARFRHRATRRRSGRRLRGGGGGGSGFGSPWGGRWTGLSRHTLRVICKIRQGRIGSRAEVDPQSFMKLQV